MAQITLNIADNQVNFFLELIKKFDFVKIEENSDYTELTQQQKDVINERLENYKRNPESYTDIEEVKNNIKKRYEV